MWDMEKLSIKELKKFEELNNILDNIEYNDVENILIGFYDKLIKNQKKDCKLVIVLTSKKALWWYKMASSYFLNSEEKNEENIEWRSDSYFKKMLNFDSYNKDNVQIIIAADTMNSGNTFHTFYEWLKDRCPEADIKAAVCLINEHYSSFQEISDNEDVRSFNNNLYAMYKASPETIGKMCVYETIIFHDDLNSYTTDLPIVREENKETCMQKIKMSYEKFCDLCEGNKTWTYYNYDYDIIPGSHTQFGFFMFHDYYMKLIFKNILFNMVVKVQYKNIEENNEVEVSFTPFVMLQSIYCKDLENCFNALFEGTKYKNELEEQKKENSDMLTNYYTAMYYAIVYVLSRYVGIEFLKYMGDGNNFSLDSAKDDKQFSGSFYADVNNIILPYLYDNYEQTKLNFYNRIVKVGNFKLANIIEESSAWFSSGIRYSNYSHEDCLAYLYEKIITAKTSENLYITSEEFEYALSKKMEYQSKEETILPVTGVLLEALNKSVINVYLSYDKAKQVIYRCYCYGENAELLLPYDARIYYKGIYCYYNKVSDENYYVKFEYFRLKFKKFLEENGIFGWLLTEEQFNFFSRYFRNLKKEDLKNQILNKNYLLTETRNNIGNVLNQLYIKINDFVEYLNFTNEAEETKNEIGPVLKKTKI
jgi:hypothetical protein